MNLIWKRASSLFEKTDYDYCVIKPELKDLLIDLKVKFNTAFQFFIMS